MKRLLLLPLLFIVSNLSASGQAAASDYPAEPALPESEPAPTAATLAGCDDDVLHMEPFTIDSDWERDNSHMVRARGTSLNAPLWSLPTSMEIANRTLADDTAATSLTDSIRFYAGTYNASFQNAFPDAIPGPFYLRGSAKAQVVNLRSKVTSDVRFKMHHLEGCQITSRWSKNRQSERSRSAAGVIAR